MGKVQVATFPSLYRDVAPDATEVPLIWTSGEGKNAKILSLVDMNYKSSNNFYNLDMPGSSESLRSTTEKAILFYQARYDARPITLAFVADLDPSKTMPNSSVLAFKMSVLEFTKLKIRGRLIGQLQPIISYTTWKCADADF